MSEENQHLREDEVKPLKATLHDLTEIVEGYIETIRAGVPSQTRVDLLKIFEKAQQGHLTTDEELYDQASDLMRLIREANRLTLH
ncbi:MAG: hypothetical protein OEY44_02895 [Candidatus Peregrinibacteria bacterium]|nr:hypothetical protein [Candidatus Peregrinibacteria bacterium]